tara:strand:+ start:2811 stop:3524 length:714 start_codon:yes stop_codon:yes gene_type:complete
MDQDSQDSQDNNMDYRVYKSLLQEKNLDTRSVLEKLGYSNMSPVELRRVFLLLTRACFSDTNNYGSFSSAELKDPELKYSHDKYVKNLDVELDYVYDPEEINVRPIVYVGLDNISFKRNVIGDLAGVSEDASTFYYENESQTAVVFRHLSTSPDLSYSLADVTSNFFLGSIDLLREGLPGLLDFKIASISKIQLPDPDRERIFRVDVAFSLDFNFVWTTHTEDQRLTTIGFEGFSHQ